MLTNMEDATTEWETAFKALANPMRVQILQWLKDPGSFPPQLEPAEEVGVCLKHIQARAKVSQSTASQYMAALQAAVMVSSTRFCEWRLYKRIEIQIEKLAAFIRQGL